MPNSRSTLSRRRFIQRTGMGLGAFLAAPSVLRARSSDGKLNIAAIGVGGRGAGNLSEVSSENIVALCDVNERNLAQAAAAHPMARTFRDFRKLYDELRDYDAVVVSTTEHTHAFATLPALRSKKHVYCEKPLTRDVREAQIIMKAAKEAGVATQMGTQIHAGENYRRVVELIRAKAIGSVREVHVWVSRAWGWQSEEEARANHDIVIAQERPKETATPPADLDWDTWIGPAPYRPYHPIYLPGPKWYRWWDFANGTMSDLGSHWNDLPFWALDLDAPLSVEASGPPPHPELAPASMTARYSYGARGDRPALTLTWYQGTQKPQAFKEGTIPRWGDAVLFIGDQGMLLSDYDKHLLLPEEKFKDFERPARSIPPSVGHHREWIQAAKTGSPTTCHFGYSGPSTIANHLGNVAYRAGKKIEWDAKGFRIPNLPAAGALLGREYRKGWSLA
jgi:predicted dehydrogenase